jgi:hypothetical protein
MDVEDRASVEAAVADIAAGLGNIHERSRNPG